MVVLADWSACELASRVLFPHITTNFFDEVGATWVNVDVIILNEPDTIHDGVLTLAARSDTIHTVLVSQLGNILDIRTVSNNLLL